MDAALVETAVKLEPKYVRPRPDLWSQNQVGPLEVPRMYGDALRFQQQRHQQSHQWPQHPHSRLPVDIPAGWAGMLDLSQPTLSWPQSWLKDLTSEQAQMQIPQLPLPGCSVGGAFLGGGAKGPGSSCNSASSGVALNSVLSDVLAVEPILAKTEHPGSNSTGHDQGRCKPCLFMHKGVCNKKLNCQYCHLPHTTSQIRRVHPSKITRRCLRWRMQGDDQPENTPAVILEETSPAQSPQFTGNGGQTLQL